MTGGGSLVAAAPATTTSGVTVHRVMEYIVNAKKAHAQIPRSVNGIGDGTTVTGR